MRVQQSRTHVLPLTWEIPATIAASWLFLSLMVLPVGEATAAWLTGRGLRLAGELGWWRRRSRSCRDSPQASRRWCTRSSRSWRWVSR